MVDLNEAKAAIDELGFRDDNCHRLSLLLASAVAEVERLRRWLLADRPLPSVTAATYSDSL